VKLGAETHIPEGFAFAERASNRKIELGVVLNSIFPRARGGWSCCKCPILVLIRTAASFAGADRF
jgi:hypothetical protein